MFSAPDLLESGRFLTVGFPAVPRESFCLGVPAGEMPDAPLRIHLLPGCETEFSDSDPNCRTFFISKMIQTQSADFRT